MKQDIRFCTARDGARLAYAVSGEGLPLVMSATWLTHLEHQWRSLAWRPWLDIFTRDHKVLRHELPADAGFQTETPAIFPLRPGYAISNA